jgi:hypothetical protein
MFGTKIAKEEYDQVNSALAEANLLNTRLEARLEEAKTTIENLGIEKAKHLKTAKQHQAELDKINTSHATELLALNTKVSRQVNQTLASIGVNTFASETIYLEKAQTTDQELLRQFTSLPQELKSEFYQANKAALSRAVLAKS